jgi:Obg family GTPase CgtA-like protein
LRTHLASLLPDAAELSEPPRSEGVVVHHIESVGDSFRVDIEDGVYVVRGKKIELLAAQTNFDVEESAERFQRELARLGVDEELRRQGVVPGLTVRIGATSSNGSPRTGTTGDGRRRRRRPRRRERVRRCPEIERRREPAGRAAPPGSTRTTCESASWAAHSTRSTTATSSIAEEVREALELDRVLFVPAALPPHKLDEEVAPAADRAAMVELAIAGNRPSR